MKKYNSFLGAFFSGDNGQGGYNAAYGKSALAKLYSSQDPAEQQMAAEGLARVDPESAGKWQQEQAALRQESMKRKATMIANAPQEQRGPLYAAVLPDIRKDWAEAPDVYTPELDQMVTAWAQSVGGGANQDGDTRWIQTIDENGKPVWAAANNRGIKPTKFGLPTTYKEVDDEATGKKWRFNVKTGQLEPVDDAYVAPQPPPTIQGADNFKQAFTGLANKHGAQITSITRTPEENRRVGGVPNSYHLTSQAGDFVVPQQNKAQFMADARAMGLDAIDEGDHIHVEPPSRGAPPPRHASTGYVGLSAADKARVQAEEKARVDLGYAGPIAAATAEGKAQVESVYGPQIAGASAQATEEGKARGQRTATGEKKVAEADDAIALLKEAEQLLAVATGGYVGAKADEFAAAFNKSSKGAEANAQLNVIAPKLIGLVPRFEGPQSDADRRLYENAAGDLGNPNKPVSVRLAAARMMMKMYQQTANKKQSADGQPKRIRITL
jgi:hypothetical protein